MACKTVTYQNCDRCGVVREIESRCQIPYYKGPYVVRVEFPIVSHHSDGPSVQAPKYADLCDICIKKWETIHESFMESSDGD